MNLTQRQNRLTTGFLVLSLLVHLLMLLIPEPRQLAPVTAPDPVYVEVRPPQQRDRELDLPVRPELEKPRETPAKRLGPATQVVQQETAPPGQDSEDSPAPASPRPAQPPAPEPAAPAERQQQQPSAAVVTHEPALPATPQGDRAASDKQPPAERPLPDLTQLTTISPTTLARIESDWRQKYRDDVQKGDTVWMDTEQDLLISFMRRFRDNIYAVWNYPAAAAEQGLEGTCLLRITVDRRGNVEDVTLLESSGFPTLDQEAIRAVRLGATYGPLPQAYPNEKLNIMAFFQYNVSRVRYTRPVRMY